jgi:hypothetical protein
VNGLKLEMFIFDGDLIHIYLLQNYNEYLNLLVIIIIIVFPYADRWVVFEVNREDEFAPVLDSCIITEFTFIRMCKFCLHSVLR